MDPGPLHVWPHILEPGFHGPTSLPDKPSSVSQPVKTHPAGLGPYSFRRVGRAPPVFFWQADPLPQRFFCQSVIHGSPLSENTFRSGVPPLFSPPPPAARGNFPPFPLLAYQKFPFKSEAQDRGSAFSRGSQCPLFSLAFFPFVKRFAPVAFGGVNYQPCMLTCEG